MVEFPKIRAFLEVAECLNFTEAAARLFTTQSSLSKTIAKFEVELGYKLFERSNREVVLTREGIVLYNSLKCSLDEIGNVIARTRRISKGVEGSFKLGMAGAVGFTDSMCDLLRGFSGFEPKFDFELTTMNFKEMREHIIAGDVDAVITKQYETTHIDGCTSLPLIKYPAVIAVRQGHPVFDRAQNPTLADFAEYGFIGISLSFSQAMYNFLFECCRREGFVPYVVLYVHTMYDLLIHTAVSDYVGVVDLSDIPQGSGLYRPVELAGDCSVCTTIIWNEANDNPALRAFLDYCKSRTASLSGPG